MDNPRAQALQALRAKRDSIASAKDSFARGHAARHTFHDGILAGMDIAIKTVEQALADGTETAPPAESTDQ